MYKHLIHFNILSSKKSRNDDSDSTRFDLLWFCGFFTPFWIMVFQDGEVLVVLMVLVFC